MEIIRRPANHPKINAFEVALKYANDVISGEVIAGKLVKLAVKRFLRDLKRGHERGLTFDKGAAQHVVDFFGLLRHTKGEWGRGPGEVFVLAPWQMFILANIFGWMNADGTRRFREAHIEVARKNGKSTFAAGIGLYVLYCDGEPGAEIYSAATKKDQAKIIFHEACRMRSKSPLLAERIKVSGKPMKETNLYVLETASKFEPLAEENQTQDGLNTHCALIDELHQHPSRATYDFLYESIKARRQPLLLTFTTAGYDRQGICYKQRTVGENILVGITEAAKGDSFFAFIACMDEKDAHGNPNKWNDERNWAAANPNLGISVKLDALRAAANKAEQDPSALNSFLRKHLNVWTNQDVRWMPPEKWAACNSAGPLIKPMDLRMKALTRLVGRECYAGMDLSSKIDLTAFVMLFPPIQEIKIREPKAQTQAERFARKPLEFEEKIIQIADPYWTVIPWFFMPEGNVAERVAKDRVDYDVWVREGFLQTTPGNTIDQPFIRTLINDLRSKYIIKEIGFDDWDATQLQKDLEQDGHKMISLRQGFKTLSSPMKETMALVLSKKLEHLGNPVLSWCALNVQATQDPAGNIKPDKEASKEKIDGIVAQIMAQACAMQHPTETGSVYTTRGITFL